ETPIYGKAGALLFVVGFGFLPLILGISYVTLLLIALFIAQGTWSARETRKQNFVALERDAFTLVKESWDVQRLVGNPFQLARIEVMPAPDGAPVRYLFQATGSQTVYP